MQKDWGGSQSPKLPKPRGMSRGWQRGASACMAQAGEGGPWVHGSRPTGHPSGCKREIRCVCVPGTNWGSAKGLWTSQAPRSHTRVSPAQAPSCTGGGWAANAVQGHAAIICSPYQDKETLSWQRAAAPGVGGDPLAPPEHVPASPTPGSCFAHSSCPPEGHCSQPGKGCSGKTPPPQELREQL